MPARGGGATRIRTLGTVYHRDRAGPPGADIRTCNPRVTTVLERAQSQGLIGYQKGQEMRLAARKALEPIRRMVPQEGLEPPTPSLRMTRSTN
jgi:hypothetical protein